MEPSVLSKGMEKDSQGNIIHPYFAMKYDIARDEKMFPYDHSDTVARDAHYMTQINDRYMHFNNYHDKTVVIEGDFLTIDGHFFIGHNGPTCPYCTGGYADFECNSRQDFTSYSWRYMDPALWEQGYLGLLQFKERCAQLKIHI